LLCIGLRHRNGFANVIAAIKSPQAPMSFGLGTLALVDACEMKLSKKTQDAELSNLLSGKNTTASQLRRVPRKGQPLARSLGHAVAIVAPSCFATLID
jgi:hypothetical protein